MTTATGDNLLRGILLHPDDDDRRLIYADWLEETGEVDRADFVRVQCLLASRYPASIDDRLHCLKPWRAGVNMPSVAGVPKGTPVAACGKCEVCVDLKRLRGRERELLASNAERWAVPTLHTLWPGSSHTLHGCAFTSAPGGFVNGSMTFRCGFIEAVECAAEAWLAHGPAIMRQHPVMRVRLTDCYALESDREPGLNRWSLVTPNTITRVFLDCWVWHDTEQAALDALSAAAAKWARLEALGEECSVCRNGKRPLPVFGQTHYTTCNVCHGIGRVIPQE